MNLLAYWRWDNYIKDLAEGAGFNFNSNQPRLHSAIVPGETLWLVTGKPDVGGIQYKLVGRLVITHKTFNAPSYKYGRFRLWGDMEVSQYYAANGPDVGALLLQLDFEPRGRIVSRCRIGQSLQTVRALTPSDDALLRRWSSALAFEPRAYAVADEERLEAAYEIGETAVETIIAQGHTGVSLDRRHRLRADYTRNRMLVRQLRELYRGRCQLCTFDPQVLYSVHACCGHHVVYLSRGGGDELENLLLVCPNHHAVIHAARAVFDYKDLHYVFANGRREPLVLNEHLTPAII